MDSCHRNNIVPCYDTVGSTQFVLTVGFKSLYWIRVAPSHYKVELCTPQLITGTVIKPFHSKVQRQPLDTKLGKPH